MWRRSFCGGLQRCRVRYAGHARVRQRGREELRHEGDDRQRRRFRRADRLPERGRCQGRDAEIRRGRGSAGQIQCRAGVELCRAPRIGLQLRPDGEDRGGQILCRSDTDPHRSAFRGADRRDLCHSAALGVRGWEHARDLEDFDLRHRAGDDHQLRGAHVERRCGALCRELLRDAAASAASR